MTTTLVLGGARSGKSRYAEGLLRHHDRVDYVALGPVPDGSDPDWSERVGEHRRRRPSGWRTVETDDPVAVLESAGAPVLLDCLSTWLTRVVDDIDGWYDVRRTHDRLTGRTSALLAAWTRASVDVVAVSSEVGMAVIPATASGRLFRDELGRLNAAVSAASDRVVLVVAGRALDLSGCPLVEP